MKKKFLVLLCALLALATLLCACGKKDETPVDTTPADTTAAPQENPLLALVENKVAKVSVVYPEYATDKEYDIAESITDLLNDSFGVTVTMKDDTAAYDASAVEILVGKTAYAESQQALAELYYSEWTVKVVGNKIVVCAHLDEGMTKANKEFYAHVITTKTADSLYVERTMLYTGKVTGLALKRDTVPVLGKNLSSHDYDVGDGCTMILYGDVSAADIEAYEGVAAAAGYWKVSSYDFLTADNKYAQYTNGETVLNVFYNEYDHRARIFAESVTVTGIVSPTVGEYDVIAGYSPKLFQVGCNDPIGTGDTTYNGECYMFYLADGSFVVFDGGHNDKEAGSEEYKRQNARRIMEIVKQYTPEGKMPTIAAWILTHGHSDHMGAFSAFDSLGYNTQVKVESVILNLPSHDMYDDLSDAESYDTSLPKYRAVAQNYVKKGADLYKAHAGQIFHVRNVDLQIVFSPDLRAHGKMTNFNTSSVVTRVVVKDATRTQDLDTVMITGDVYGEGTAVMVNLYGDAMRCNLVQMPHHGYYKHDAAGKFWQNVKANYIMWPIAKEKPGSTPTQGDWHGDLAVWTENYVPWLKANMFNDDMNSDKIFWAYFDTIVFDLPFTGQNFTRTTNTVYS